MSVAPILALASALCYGIVDVTGGLLSRRWSPTRVAFAAQLGALVLTVPAACLVSSHAVTVSDLAWGAVSGLGTGFGMMFLYRGLALGDFSIVVPIAAVGGVAIPVIVGVTLLADRPSAVAWTGMILAVPALWVLLRQGRGSVGFVTAASFGGARHAALASVGIAVQYLALAQANSTAGLWPIAAGRVTALAAVAPFLLTATPSERLTIRGATAATLTGGGAAVALYLYLLAADKGMLSVTVVLASLYPIVPVFLGIVSYGESLSRKKVIALIAAGLAVAMLTTS